MKALSVPTWGPAFQFQGPASPREHLAPLLRRGEGPQGTPQQSRKLGSLPVRRTP